MTTAPDRSIRTNALQCVRPITVLCALVLSMGPAGAASFNCAQARTGLEKQVCSDVNLSRLDEELARTYKQVLEGSPAPDDTRESQRRWIHGSRDPCKTAECLARAYGTRIRELASVAARLPFQPDMGSPAVTLPAVPPPESIVVSSRPSATKPAEIIGRIEFGHDAAGGRWDVTSGKRSFTLRHVWQVNEADNAALGRIADSGAFVLVRGRWATLPGNEIRFDDGEAVLVHADKAQRAR